MITIHTATGEVFPLDDLTRSYIRALQDTYGSSEEGWQLRTLGLKGWREGAENLDEGAVADMLAYEAEVGRR